MLSVLEDKLIHSKSINIPIWLRDTYATISDETILNLTIEPGNFATERGLELYLKGITNSHLFMTGTDIYIIKKI